MNTMRRLMILGILVFGLVVFGCTGGAGQQPPANNTSITNPMNNDTVDSNANLHMICSGSVCCMGFGNECATFKCASNVYYVPGGRDAASIYVNGTSGEVIARCGGNMIPINADMCPNLEKTCDMTKPADLIPYVVKNPTIPMQNDTKQNDTMDNDRLMHTALMEKCNLPNVDKVYLCNNDLVRTVSAIPGAGSTFYKTDGSVANCPLVAPEAMSPVCKTLMDACLEQNEVECDN